tara:strand:- start:412 stop:594 length:183 start_codon:yes stop_codon:yes gene_type:complete
MKQNLSKVNYNNSSECCLPCALECKKINDKINGRELSDIDKDEIQDILSPFNIKNSSFDN